MKAHIERSMTMTTKHTPGPWRVDFSTTNGPIAWKILHGDQLIGWTSCPHFDTRWDKPAAEYPENAEGVANALVQAAAPDLLAALQAIVAWDDRPSRDFIPERFLEPARAAIDKALRRYAEMTQSSWCFDCKSWFSRMDPSHTCENDPNYYCPECGQTLLKYVGCEHVLAGESYPHE